MMRQRGFTLIELMVVIAILGILAASAYPTYRTFRGRAVGAEASFYMDKLLQAEIAYYLEKNMYFPDPGPDIWIPMAKPPVPPADSYIQQVRDNLKITLPVGHFLDFRIRNDGMGSVWIWIDSNIPIFQGGATGIHATMDSSGNITYF